MDNFDRMFDDSSASEDGDINPPVNPVKFTVGSGSPTPQSSGYNSLHNIIKNADRYYFFFFCALSCCFFFGRIGHIKGDKKSFWPQKRQRDQTAFLIDVNVVLCWN